MKAAHLMAGAPEGGAERFFERLIPALARAGETVLPVIRHQGDRVERLREAGVKPRELPFGGRLDLFTRPCLAWQLRKFAPRVVFAWMGRAARHAPTGPWGPGRPPRRLLQPHPLRPLRPPGRQHPGRRRLDSQPGFSARARPPAAELRPRPGRRRPPPRFRCPPGAPIVLSMGRLHNAKGHDVLLAALTRLPGVHAVIAGEGPERAALIDLARQAGVADRTHFLGWRHDTAELLAACDVLVCPPAASRSATRSSKPFPPTARSSPPWRKAPPNCSAPAAAAFSSRSTVPSPLPRHRGHAEQPRDGP